MSRNFVSDNEAQFHRGQTDPAPLLLRRTRRSLLTGLGLAAAAAAAWALTAPDELAPVVMGSLLAFHFCFRWMARRGTRGLAIAPARLLDERQIQEVHSAYRHAHKIAVAVIGVACLISIVVPLHIGMAGLFLLLYLMVWLPTSVLAWRLDDEDPAESGAATA